MKVKSITVFLAALLCGGVAGAQTDAKFPSQITTSDGTLYKGAVKIRVDPDGILVSYQPVEHGIGLAKLKFRDLPENLQKQYGYDPKSAAEYEKQAAQAADQWRAQIAADEAWARYYDVAVLHQGLAGSDAVSYSVSMDSNSKVSAQGVTGTTPSITVNSVGAPSAVALPYRTGPYTEYVPLQLPVGTMLMPR